MIGTVVLTALVTILGMSVFHLIRERDQDRSRNAEIKSENEQLKSLVNFYKNNEQYRREQHCYSEGVVDGEKKAQLQQRFADGLSNNGQATILINMNDKIH